MRTKTLICTAAALAAGLASSVAQTVYSQNIVGYVNVTNTPGFSLIANPLQATNNNITSLFAGAPNFTKILRFDGSAYLSYTLDPDDGWVGPGGPGDTFNLNPGEGVFVQVGSTYAVTFVGDVIQNSTNPVPAGFSLKASVVPQAGLIQTDLLYPAANFDKILRWNGTAYVSYTLDPDDGWVGPGGPGDQPNIRVAEGFFIQTGAAKVPGWVRNFVP
jgi:hypothetical protein